MSVVVKNVGAVEYTATGLPNTRNLDRVGGTAGSTHSSTVRVVLRGVEYVWGPNESKTLPDDLAAEAVAASNSRLRVADTRDGFGGQART